MNTAGEPIAAIRVRSLTKDFALPLRGTKLRAVDDLSLNVPGGTVYGLLGPNGSGKSTTIKVMLGLLEPTRGSCEVFGVPSREVRSRIDLGYLPEAPYFYRYLSGRELLVFYGRLSRMDRALMAGRVDEVLDWVGLTHAARRRVGTYSKGMLQRVGIAQALIHDPRLVILDEPTAGVDPVGAAEISELIVKLKSQGKTVLLCSHLLAQVEGICDRIAILDRGRLVLEGRVDDLVTAGNQRSLVVENFPTEATEDFRSWLATRGGRLVGVEKPRTSLDRVFLAHVNRSVSPAGERSEEVSGLSDP